MKFLCEGVQKLKPEQIYTQMDRQTVTHTDRHTDRQTDRQTHSHDWKHYLPIYVGGKKEKLHLSMYDTNVIQLGNTNNKMATPAPVQLQLPLTVSGLVCCVFVYGCDYYIAFSLLFYQIFNTETISPKVYLQWIKANAKANFFLIFVVAQCEH